ncbi:MAG TPA: fibronectin type III domain-containing protein [Candidatus Polarisedimenticolia bacterium]|nr:fibronectin type III domain-containing protein [Candidatus Polarisedimenticolia bacterium]
MCVLGAGVRDAAAATMRLSWSSDTEADLSGYRLRYGTAPGSVDAELDTGRATTAQVNGLSRGVTYYFSVVAYDVSGNESTPSTEVTARLTTDLSPPPVIESAMETSSGSIYAVRSQARFIQVHGQNFDAGATVNLGPDIAVQAPSLTPQGDLLVGVSIPANAVAGPRTVTVSNPDLGVGSGSGLIAVVKSPDANGDCAIDIVDLNTLARSWNLLAGEAHFAPPVDLDGDGYVGPDDLTILVTYYGREFSGCP